MAAAVLTTAGVVAPAVPPAPAGAAGPAPTIRVSPSTASPGQRVNVAGRNFPPDTNIQAQVCGNNALNGSADCVQSTAQEVSTTPKGIFQIPIVVTIPPKPCPCVVMVLDFDASVTPTTPINIIGAPYAQPKANQVHKLQVLNAYLNGNGPWTSWFGASPQRTLVLTVRNPNPVPYVSPPLVLRVGQTDNTSTKEATIHNLATLGAYQTKTYDVAVSFPAMSIGEHEVVGTVGNAGLTKTFTVQTWLFPWGLLIVALILLEIILLLLTRYFRERRRRKEEEEGRLGETGPPTSPEGTPAVAAMVGAVPTADGAPAPPGNGAEPAEPVTSEPFSAKFGSPPGP